MVPYETMISGAEVFAQLDGDEVHILIRFGDNVYDITGKVRSDSIVQEAVDALLDVQEHAR